MNIAMDLIREALLGGSGGGGGGGTDNAPDNDVMLYDYDGTVLYSYSKADFLQLTAYPDAPAHNGLTSDGWNWPLADAKTYVTKNRYLDIGLMYSVTDGTTKFVYRNDDENGYTVAVAFKSSAANNATIDWGDGSAQETIGATSRTEYPHTYATGGEHIASLKVNSGTVTFENSQNASCAGNLERACYVRKLHIGSSITLNNYALGYMLNLEAVTIPKTFSGLSSKTYMFVNDYNLIHLTLPYGFTAPGSSFINSLYCLRSICMPSTMTGFGTSNFTSCSAIRRWTPPVTSSVQGLTAASCLKVCVIPEGVTSVSGYVSGQGFCLNSITIPSTMTSIATLMNNARPLTEYHVKATSPPSLTKLNNNGPSPSVVYVPADSVSAYKTASGWSTYESVIVGE